MLQLKNKKRSIFFGVLFFLITTLLLYGCNFRKTPPKCGDYLVDKPQDRFRYDVESPIAFDKLTRISWYRCNAGQVFQDGKCVGESLKLNWTEAQSYAREFSASSGKNWRLPEYWQMRELQRFDCISPAIDIRAFPDLQVSHYWSRDEHIFSKRMSCSVYTYKGQGFCWQRKTVELPFMLVSDENAERIKFLGRVQRVLIDFFN